LRRVRPTAAPCGLQKGDGKVTAIAPNPCVCRDFMLLSAALSRRRPRVRVPSLPSAAARSVPLRAALLPCRGGPIRCPSPFCSRVRCEAGPASAGHWAIVRSRPAQQVEVVQASWSGARCRLLASSTPTITGSPPLGRPHCGGSARRCSSSPDARCSATSGCLGGCLTHNSRSTAGSSPRRIPRATARRSQASRTYASACMSARSRVRGPRVLRTLH
jgi:hypothetical protein